MKRPQSDAARAKEILAKVQQDQPLTDADLHFIAQKSAPLRRKPGRPTKLVPDAIDAEGFAPNLEVLGEACGVDRKSIDNARKRFASTAPKKRADGRYNIEEHQAWLNRHGITGRRKSAELEDERAIRIDLLRIDRDQKQFNLDKARESQLPVAQFERALAKTLAAFLQQLNAFGPRVNENLEGLEFDERADVIEREVELLRKTLASCDYLAVEEEEDNG